LELLRENADIKVVVIGHCPNKPGEPFDLLVLLAELKKVYRDGCKIAVTEDRLFMSIFRAFGVETCKSATATDRVCEILAKCA
jgi:hypothetical protein